MHVDALLRDQRHRPPTSGHHVHIVAIRLPHQNKSSSKRVSGRFRKLVKDPTSSASSAAGLAGRDVGGGGGMLCEIDAVRRGISIDAFTMFWAERGRGCVTEGGTQTLKLTRDHVGPHSRKHIPVYSTEILLTTSLLPLLRRRKRSDGGC